MEKDREFEVSQILNEMVSEMKGDIVKRIVDTGGDGMVVGTVVLPIRNGSIRNAKINSSMEKTVKFIKARDN